MLYARQMAGWKTKNNNSSTTESELWRNAGPSAFKLQESISKRDKIWCAYLVVNCVGLRTFWTWFGVFERVSQFCQKFKVELIIRARLDRPVNTLQHCRRQFAHKETL